MVLLNVTKHPVGSWSCYPLIYTHCLVTTAWGGADLHALDLQLHMVLSCCFSILPFLPAVSVLPVLHFLPVVEDDAAILGPETESRPSGYAL